MKYRYYVVDESCIEHVIRKTKDMSYKRGCKKSWCHMARSFYWGLIFVNIGSLEISEGITRQVFPTIVDETIKSDEIDNKFEEIFNKVRPDYEYIHYVNTNSLIDDEDPTHPALRENGDMYRDAYSWIERLEDNSENKEEEIKQQENIVNNNQD